MIGNGNSINAATGATGDTFTVNGTSNTVTANNDTVFLSASIDTVTVNGSGNSITDNYSTTSGATDTITISGGYGGGNTVHCGYGSDTVYVNSVSTDAKNTIEGGGGAYLLPGKQAGIDSSYLGGQDVFHAGQGNDLYEWLTFADLPYNYQDTVDGFKATYVAHYPNYVGGGIVYNLDQISLLQGNDGGVFYNGANGTGGIDGTGNNGGLLNKPGSEVFTYDGGVLDARKITLNFA